MSTPSDYGYAPCIRCGTQRPRSSLSFAIVYDSSTAPITRTLTDAECNWTCIDVKWCAAQVRESGRCKGCFEIPRGTDPALSNGVCAFCGYWGIPPGPEREAMRLRREGQIPVPHAIEGKAP